MQFERGFERAEPAVLEEDDIDRSAEKLSGVCECRTQLQQAQCLHSGRAAMCRRIVKETDRPLRVSPEDHQVTFGGTLIQEPFEKTVQRCGIRGVLFRAQRRMPAENLPAKPRLRFQVDLHGDVRVRFQNGAGLADQRHLVHGRFVQVRPAIGTIGHHVDRNGPRPLIVSCRRHALQSSPN
jgi:hypothetical protein